MKTQSKIIILCLTLTIVSVSSFAGTSLLILNKIYSFWGQFFTTFTITTGIVSAIGYTLTYKHGLTLRKTASTSTPSTDPTPTAPLATVEESEEWRNIPELIANLDLSKLEAAVPEEKAIVYHDYVTINGEEPQLPKSFLQSKAFLCTGIALAIIIGILSYLFLFHH
jgi:hypothetical protein